MTWHAGRLTGFDLETTGTDVETDRIVTAAIVAVAPDGRPPEPRTWLLDPGVTIPPQASAIHGISTAHAREHGMQPARAIEEITAAVTDVLNSGTPLVVMNARYDLSLLDRECRRHGIRPLVDRLHGRASPVIDPLVLDKHVDRYRKGSRNLRALCAHYGVPLEHAHNAVADAVAAACAARSMGVRHAIIGALTSTDLHDLQIRAAAEQAASLQRYLRRTSNPEATIEPAWPVIPYAG